MVYVQPSKTQVQRAERVSRHRMKKDGLFEGSEAWVSEWARRTLAYQPRGESKRQRCAALGNGEARCNTL